MKRNSFKLSQHYWIFLRPIMSDTRWRSVNISSRTSYMGKCESPLFIGKCSVGLRRMHNSSRALQCVLKLARPDITLCIDTFLSPRSHFQISRRHRGTHKFQFFFVWSSSEQLFSISPFSSSLYDTNSSANAVIMVTAVSKKMNRNSSIKATTTTTIVAKKTTESSVNGSISSASGFRLLIEANGGLGKFERITYAGGELEVCETRSTISKNSIYKQRIDAMFDDSRWVSFAVVRTLIWFQQPPVNSHRRPQSVAVVFNALIFCFTPDR